MAVSPNQCMVNAQGIPRLSGGDRDEAESYQPKTDAINALSLRRSFRLIIRQTLSRSYHCVGSRYIRHGFSNETAERGSP